MLIVSQDKSTIINIDKISLITQTNGEIGATDEIICPNCFGIGKYKTEERAKEVLQEIIERYTNWENFKAGQPEGIISPKYEMPLE